MLNRWENQTDSRLLQIKDITIYTIELAIRTIDEIIEERNKESQYQA
jgi:2-methylcitrate dehydratase PrpD